MCSEECFSSTTMVTNIIYRFFRADEIAPILRSIFLFQTKMFYKLYIGWSKRQFCRNFMSEKNGKFLTVHKDLIKSVCRKINPFNRFLLLLEPMSNEYKSFLHSTTYHSNSSGVSNTIRVKYSSAIHLYKLLRTSYETDFIYASCWSFFFSSVVFPLFRAHSSGGNTASSSRTLSRV